MTDSGNADATELDDDGAAVVPPASGSSPYSTGAGGVTFERKVAVMYLARLLTGDGATELGDGRTIASVRFQQAPEHPVDDLVIHAEHTDDAAGASLVLAIGVRRSPKIVPSDESTTKLFTDFVRAVINAPADGHEYRLALVVAGTRQHAEQLAVLADLAARQMNAFEFFDLVRTPQRFAQEIRDRLDHFVAIVKNALIALGHADPDDATVEPRVWELLARLTVLMPRLEAPDETDWTNIANTLITVARKRDLAGAIALRDRLGALAAGYSPTAATVDLSLLRRDAHTALDTTVRRHRKGWEALVRLHESATASTRDVIRSADGQRTVHIDRSAEAAKLLGSAATGTAVVAHGESGVGKSALVLDAATSAAMTDPDVLQVLCINLRDLPALTIEFEAILECPLATLLAELSAPRRLLIIDGADAVAEGRETLLRYLIDAAHDARLGVIALSTTDNQQVVRDALAARFTDVVDHELPDLTDAEIDIVVTAFPELNNLAANARSRDLLRRPVVIDLLVRGGVSGVPFSDADAMREVWAGLVRRRELADRGIPDARQFVLLQLAKFELAGGDALEVAANLDAVALAGLRHDGVLSASPETEWQVLPEFAHDEIRRYAVARVLLVNRDPADELLAAGAPRWALPAARLACQALLASPDNPAMPLRGRLAGLQAGFDALVDAGHGARWGDVPAEALLGIADPAPILADAWDDLRAGEAAGLRRVARLLDQRHRRSGVIDAVIIEPVVARILDDAAPWRAGAYVTNMLRDWLHALIIANAAAGLPLRLQLRARLLAACDAGDARLTREREEAAAARAARTPEEIEEERERIERNRSLFTAIGHGGRKRRERPPVPREITDGTMLELLALLGPDLGDRGEHILRRVASDAPSHLAPAVEELLTGQALALFGPALLADLTAAYYIDEDGGGFGFMDDGIRRHHARGIITPLHAWYRGPFMPLFRADFRRGVAVLNRMLNHAALVSKPDPNFHGLELCVTGERRVYSGDGATWTWYRGTSAGPYPCMSALAALEIVCDELIEAGARLPNLLAILLDGCESLAMLGLIVGMLLRHIERAATMLDPFLAEPSVWHLEFSRKGAEYRGLVAGSDHVTNSERRGWTLRDAATWLVAHADAGRAEELRSIGSDLTSNAVKMASGGAVKDFRELTNPEAIEYVATVRNWAATLDTNRYTAFEHDGVRYIQAVPEADVIATLNEGNADLARGREAMRIMWRYAIQQSDTNADPITDGELAADLAIAKALLDDPPSATAYAPLDAAAAIAGVALQAHILRDAALPPEMIEFAAQTVLKIAEGVVPSREDEYEGSYFEEGADRSTARALPLLLLPSAAQLRTIVGEGEERTGYRRVMNAALRIAHAAADETRLHLARGLDPVWSSSCTPGECVHEDALAVALESMRTCVLGPWNPDRQRSDLVSLEEPYIESLKSIPDDAILMSRLDGAIRTCGSAAIAIACVSGRALASLLVLTSAQRRSLAAHEHNYDERGTHALVAARALLNLATTGADQHIHDHLRAYSDSAALLSTFLRALAAAAEENESRADACRRVWPSVIDQVLDFADQGHHPFHDDYFGDMALAALMPTPTYEGAFLYREVDHAPIVWADPLAWRPQVERWLRVAAGNASAVDSLVGLLRTLPLVDQVSIGLAWVSAAVLGDVAAVARRSYLLSPWLSEVRDAASDYGVINDWQRLVDALVVAGDTTLAPYSE